MIAGNPGLPSVPDALGWHPPMSLEFRMQLKVERFGFYGCAQGAERFVRWAVRSQTQITGEEAHALIERYAKVWSGVLGFPFAESSDVASALATYRGTATHAVADLLGAPLTELKCKAVEVTVNLRTPKVSK